MTGPHGWIYTTSRDMTALDARTKRIVEKELRAAWGAKGARWLSNLDSPAGAGPAFYLSCQDKVAATAIALKVRINLAHFVASVRRQLSQWAVHFVARGHDGQLQLTWGLDVSHEDAIQSLLGRLPKDQVSSSAGRQFWDDRDGGVSLLSPGSWTWDPRRAGPNPGAAPDSLQRPETLPSPLHDGQRHTPVRQRAADDEL